MSTPSEGGGTAHGLSGVAMTLPTPHYGRAHAPAAYCRTHPDAVVVSVGIGLDTRAERLAGALPPSVTWLGVDMPEVVELRATLLPGDRARVFPASITEPDWAEQLLPLTGERRNVGR